MMPVEWPLAASAADRPVDTARPHAGRNRLPVAMADFFLDEGSRLTDEERARFTELNDRYVRKFGFPFIIAVRDNTKASILAAFETRIANDRETEFATACKQVERIGLLRLKALLPT